jgi:hypothetical protein
VHFFDSLRKAMKSEKAELIGYLAIIAIDEKRVCNSGGNGKAAISAEMGIALGQVKTEDKFVEKIIEKGSDYVISLKGNQESLHDDVKLFLEMEQSSRFKNTTHDYFETIES